VYHTEDITSRFLNVISLFNGAIPLIAIQLSAMKFDDTVALVFSKVLDELMLGMVGDDEEVAAVTDRAYWEKRGSKSSLKVMDNAYELVRTLDPELELKYNKFYVGLAKDGSANNFVAFKPQKNALRIEVRLERSEEVEASLEEAGMEVLDYDSRSGRYKIRLTPGDVLKHPEVLTELFAKARAAAA
jgi:predicted transport protein